MPTQRISPDSAELLQEVADGLLKARKVVVVTGAGISTNSGIPVPWPHTGLAISH
jgi:NAD-dependent SIR2 family protein deacetylase